MGFFDLFKGGDKESAEKKARKASKKETSAAATVQKYGARAADKRAQNYDRAEAITMLAEIGTSDSAAALLRRFTFTLDPSITDQEEKDAAAQGVAAAGRDAIEPIREFASKAESVSWPMKILKELVDENEFVEEILSWLDEWDTEYAKFIDPKLQLLVELEEHRHEKIREAVEPFLEDVNETARFHAACATFHQEDESAATAILKMLPDEESFRVKNKIADSFAQRGWKVPDDLKEATAKVLPPGFSIDKDSKIRKG